LQRDSSIKSTSWTFTGDGKFVANESGEKKTGTWNVDEKKMLLFTTIDSLKDSVKFTLADGTLTLQFDSLNSMTLKKNK